MLFTLLWAYTVTKWTTHTIENYFLYNYLLLSTSIDYFITNFTLCTNIHNRQHRHISAHISKRSNPTKQRLSPWVCGFTSPQPSLRPKEAPHAMLIEASGRIIAGLSSSLTDVLFIWSKLNHDCPVSYLFAIFFHQSLLFHCNSPHTTERWHVCRYLRIMELDSNEGALSSAPFLEDLHQTHVGEASPPCSINELDRSYSSFLRLTCFLQRIRSCSSNSPYRPLIMMWFGGWYRVGSRILLHLKHSTAVDETIVIILITNLFSLVLKLT